MRLPLIWLLLLASTLPLGLTACLPSTASLQAPQDGSTPFQKRSRSHLAQSISPSGVYSNESLKTYQDMLTLARDRKDRKLEGMALVGIGSIYLYQEKFTQTIEHLEPGLKLAREMKDVLSEKRALMNLSVAYTNIGQADKAIPYAQGLLAIAKQENDIPLQGVALQGLGVAEALKKNYRQAITYYEQSLNAFHQVQDTEREAFVLSAMGEVYTQMGQLEKGIAYQERSRALSQKTPKRTESPKGQTEEVTKLLAVQPTDSWNVVAGKAISSRQLGRIDEAIASFARYGEMFKATDPTAEQYSRVAQAFTRQMRSLNVKGGVYIYQLAPGSSTAQKGLAVGDIIVSLNGQSISTMPEFVAVRDRAIKGKSLEIVYLQLNGNQFRRYTITVNNPMGAALMPI